MKELTIEQTELATGGFVFLAPVAMALFAPTTITAGGVATALGIGAGLGAIGGGLMAVFD